ncbi:glycosyltransferase family 2 protein [Candidatus Sumerlaeota bacterium]|nr:glycosyltransferase family 2 protein [Candidatus Sumerlaeota bacterium]
MVPTYNRRPVLECTIECLLQQEFPEGEYEVVVVDDQSTDDTAEWLAGAAAQNDRLTAIRNPSKGRGQARNAGIRAAHGETICFVDDDVWVVPGFVAAHWAAHQRYGPKAVIVGRLDVSLETAKTIANEYEDERLVRVEERIQAAKDNLHPGFFRTGNVSVRAHFLQEVGGFDEGFTGYSYEDSELGYRLLANGAEFRYAPDAAGEHYTATSTADVLRKQAEAGRSAVTFLRRWPEAVERLSVPFAVPGVPTTAKRDGMIRRVAKWLLLSRPCGLAMGWLMVAAEMAGWKRGSFFLLDWLGWTKYARAFREAARDGCSAG